ncbi:MULTISPECIES: Ail/Lom family outer membrane beta-barrel protein [Photorhabdus]|uniref:Ail/Lom family outer membrane beta-barrel protein n=1 Tax=Photorhabdus TaxID=29487 RepID=UPI000DCDDC7E|nr:MULTISPECIES: Ail/Lom family outer membrane beta-barrel protein [Photorhabdus]MCT8341619.1 outer membrane beta-barrel protein [Photorhabdus kleinii]RAX04390.1 attachment protein [Photorhabdus sp. S9-53]RAX04721.1 attachment protein [Photorhabdus sp. S10-54]RAX06339.1 attachment protein [Photorhabdus sp. S8-52]
MKKALIASAVAVGLSVFTFAANAGESSISGGYAQSHVKVDGEKLDENPKGFNLKYRYELDNNFGVIGSFTLTHQGYNYYYGSRKIGTGDLDYYSLMAGPTYRFNEYVSVYGLVGAAHGKEKAKGNAAVLGYDVEYKESKTSAAYGLGLQFNPMPNWVIDASYEYSKVGDYKIGTWVIGAGYRF